MKCTTKKIFNTINSSIYHPFIGKFSKRNFHTMNPKIRSKFDKSHKILFDIRSKIEYNINKEYNK